MIFSSNVLLIVVLKSLCVETILNNICMHAADNMRLSATALSLLCYRGLFPWSRPPPPNGVFDFQTGELYTNNVKQVVFWLDEVQVCTWIDGGEHREVEHEVGGQSLLLMADPEQGHFTCTLPVGQVVGGHTYKHYVSYFARSMNETEFSMQDTKETDMVNWGTPLKCDHHVNYVLVVTLILSSILVLSMLALSVFLILQQCWKREHRTRYRALRPTTTRPVTSRDAEYGDEFAPAVAPDRRSSVYTDVAIE